MIFKIIFIFLLILAFTGISAFLFIFFKYRFLWIIRAKTIHLQKPIVTVEKTVERKAIHENDFLKGLIEKEQVLRKFAYTNTSIKINDSFFDDSDLQTDYYLLIVYHKKTKTPLLSARYYFDKSLIHSYLKGDADIISNELLFWNVLDLDKFKQGDIFLSDRLSANHSSSIYRKHRTYIHTLFYSELCARNKTCKYVIMARKEKQEKLLANYLRWGLKIVGLTTLKEKEHWILLGDLKKEFDHMKNPAFVRRFLMLRDFF